MENEDTPSNRVKIPHIDYLDKSLGTEFADESAPVCLQMFFIFGLGVGRVVTLSAADISRQLPNRCVRDLYWHS